MSITYDNDTGMVSDVFEIPHGDLIYKDAIVMPTEEYDAMTQDQVEAVKQARFNQWLSVIAPSQEA